MAKATTPKRTGNYNPGGRLDHQAVMDVVCEHLASGKSLNWIVENVPGMPSATAILEWVRKDPDTLGLQYARAREKGYMLIADDIIDISEQTHTWTTVQELNEDGKPLLDDKGNPIFRKVLVPLSPDVIAHNRLRIDTRKWMLSKMLPKVYGDKLDLTSKGEKIGITISGDDANL